MHNNPLTDFFLPPWLSWKISLIRLWCWALSITITELKCRITRSCSLKYFSYISPSFLLQYPQRSSCIKAQASHLKNKPVLISCIQQSKMWLTTNRCLQTTMKYGKKPIFVLWLLFPANLYYQLFQNSPKIRVWKRSPFSRTLIFWFEGGSLIFWFEGGS